MNLLKNYIQNFISRAGNHILIASILSRVLSFTASWFALQLIPNIELGIVLYAYHIIAFIIPIAGLGLHQSLLRYGALMDSTAEKTNLFLYVLKKGIIATIFMILIIVVISMLVSFQFENTQYYIIGFSLILIPSFIFEIIKIKFRLLYQNKLFAYSEIVYNVILVLAVFTLSYFYKEIGYAIALIITPIITILLFLHKINFSGISKPIITQSFWSYGIFASLANVATQLLFIIDLLLIGYLLNSSEMVTNYKYITLIPLSLLFLPRVFINTDFVAFTEKIKDKAHTYQYIRSYLLLFTIISVLCCAVFGLFSEDILLFLDPDFLPYKKLFLLFLLGVCGILIFRGLFGNLLSSIGQAKINFYITGIAILLNICSNFYFIPTYGILGAAMTSAVLMWLTGLASALLFYYNYNKVFLNKK